MCDLAAAVRALLTTDDAVNALIGTRVYPSYDQQADRQYPLAVYKLEISPVPCFDGPSGVSKAVARIAAIADTDIVAFQVADAVREAMDQQKGTWAGCTVQGFFLQDDGIQDDVVTDPSTEEILYYVRNISFDVIFDD